MYLPHTCTTEALVLSVGLERRVSLVCGYEWVDAVLMALSAFFFYMVSVLSQCGHAIGWAIREFVRNPGAWTVHAIVTSYKFLHNHPHAIYLTCLSIFFGPIIVLVPFLLCLELVTLLLFNLSFISHGLLPGRLEDQYGFLKEHFMEPREKVFASVEAATATFNQWTTDHTILRITRVLAGVLGIYILYGLWAEVSHA